MDYEEILEEAPEEAELQANSNLPVITWGIDGNLLYFGSDGKMAKGWLDKWTSVYYFDEDGVMQTGFVDIGNDTYYYNEKGHQTRSVWVNEDGKTYYIKADGTMAKAETIKRWGKKYSFDENGVLIQ